ncbi:MAG: toprim domain-containing protein [Patescibacteria group bacterium]
MNAIEKLTEKFRDFPGIGPRQAKRFVYFLLSRHGGYLDEISTLIKDVKKEISQCPECFRLSPKRNGNSCSICFDTSRDNSLLAIVEKDIDLENIERSGAYRGRYFVLGDALPILEKNPEKRIRSTELFSRISTLSEKGTLKEVILALSANAEGENTDIYIKNLLRPLQEKHPFVISVLGRGLSTGSEVEYADSDTLKNAFLHRDGNH